MLRAEGEKQRKQSVREGRTVKPRAAKVILLAKAHNDIIFASHPRQANITGRKGEYHCAAIPLAVRQI